MFDSSDEENGDVELTPFVIDRLNLTPYGCSESLSISALPGCKFKNTWRDLKHDLECIKSAKIQEVFVLCTKGELHKYRVPSFLDEVTSAGFVLHHYPFLDGSTPPMDALVEMLDIIKVNLMNGVESLVHCFGGLGRSCLVAVCLLLMLDPNETPASATDKVRQLRGPGAIQTVKQFNFIHEFRDDLACFVRKSGNRTVSR